MRCSVLGCKSDGERKTPGLSFHSFPNKQSLREIWISATGRNMWEPKKPSKICSKHFETAYLIKKLTKTYLDHDAVPTKFIKLVDSRTHEDPLPSTSFKFTYPSSSDVKQCSTKCMPQTSPQITPGTLERKWKKEKKRSEERLKKIKALREKLRRLTKKAANLENIVTELRSRLILNNEDCELLVFG